MNKITENLLLLFCKLIPLRKKVVFRSFNGHYSDSPKAISEALHNARPDIRIIWLVNQERMNELPEYAEGVGINTAKSIFHLATTAAFIDNNYGRKGIVITKDNNAVFAARILAWLNGRKGQVNLSTWHGTPLKKIGNDQYGSTGVDLITPPLLLVHPNVHTRDVMDRITFHRARHETLGLPRNDSLFYPERRREIKRKLGIPEEKRVILYAPTFRSDGYDTDNRNVERSGLAQIREIRFDDLFERLKNKFGGDDWVFIGRFHYFVEKEINWDKLQQENPGRIMNGNAFDDMSDYLAAADVLLTDCSSCMFDYAFTERPVFLFFPDVKHYEGVERGFYFDMKELPFSCSTSFDDLLIQIDQFEDVSYVENVKKLNGRLGAADDGSAAKKVIELMIKESGILSERKG